MKFPLSIFFLSLMTLTTVSSIHADNDKNSKNDHGDRGGHEGRGDANRVGGGDRDRRDSNPVGRPQQQQIQRNPQPIQQQPQRQEVRQRDIRQSGNNNWNPQNNVTQTYRNSGQNRETLQGYARKFQDQRRPINQDEINKKTREYKNSYAQREGYQKQAKDLATQIRGSNANFRNWSNEYSKNHRYHDHNVQYNNYWGGSRWNNVSDWLGWGSTVYPYYYDNGYALPIGSDWQNFQGYGDGGYYANYYGNPYAGYVYPENSYYGGYNNFYKNDAQDWLPMGVFALGSDINAASNSDIFMQLLINKEGDISGTYYNSSTNRSFPMEGYVNRTTQQVYWHVPGESAAPEMSTGLYNLTQDVGSIQLTFPAGPIQNWVLVKVDE